MADQLYEFHGPFSGEPRRLFFPAFFRGLIFLGKSIAFSWQALSSNVRYRNLLSRRKVHGFVVGSSRSPTPALTSLSGLSPLEKILSGRGRGALGTRQLVRHLAGASKLFRTEFSGLE